MTVNCFANPSAAGLTVKSIYSCFLFVLPEFSISAVVSATYSLAVSPIFAPDPAVMVISSSSLNVAVIAPTVWLADATFLVYSLTTGTSPLSVRQK